MTTKMSTVRSDEGDDQKRDPMSQQPNRKKPYQQYDQTFSAQHVHFYISDEIIEPELYTDMIHRINAASFNDVIFIHLNTPGGRLDTGVQIINAMQNSQAKIVTVLESMAFSLGTLIFLAGDEMVVNDHCMMMFHNFKGGVYGKGQELVSQLDATVKWFEMLAKKIYIPFLSEEEFKAIVKGEDLWLHSAEIRKRLDRVIKLAQKDVDKKEGKKGRKRLPKEIPVE